MEGRERGGGRVLVATMAHIKVGSKESCPDAISMNKGILNRRRMTDAAADPLVRCLPLGCQRAQTEPGESEERMKQGAMDDNKNNNEGRSSDI